jgi:hypothetical protein
MKHELSPDEARDAYINDIYSDSSESRSETDEASPPSPTDHSPLPYISTDPLATSYIKTLEANSEKLAEACEIAEGATRGTLAEWEASK